MNKILKRILALVLGCALSVSAFAGCTSNECEHDVSKWVVQTAATCNSQGLKMGICALCGKTLYQTIDYDDEAHVYGDWEITSYPTETRTGTAYKTCTLNSEHKLRITLPVLGSDMYTSTVTKRPTASTAGERTYVYPHEQGDIVFTSEISNTGITSVRDAVEVCADSVSHELVRNGTGTVSNLYYSSGSTASSSSSYSFFYEYGDGYTHIDDKAYDNRERWYSYDEDGDVLGYCQYGSDAVYEETKTTAGASQYIDGYRYVFTYATYVGTYYGTENLISGLYTAARANGNNDFEESTYVNGDGETVYSFSYGQTSLFTNGGYFSIITAEFTITSEYTIKWCNVECVTYINQNLTDDTTDDTDDADDDKDSGTADDDEEEVRTWYIDEDGYAYVPKETAMGMRYVSTFTVDQVTRTDDPVEPVNPYTAESTHISSFDVAYLGEVIGDDDVVNITANMQTSTNGVYDFEITNIVPTSMANSLSSELTFYYRQYTNDDKTEYEDVEINSGTGGYTNVGITLYLSSSTGKFFIKCNIAGEIDIVAKTSKAEKVIHLNVAEVAPSTLYPRIYKYSTSGYSWSSSSSSSTTQTVYIGQPLYFSTYVADSEAKYASTRYTAAVTGATDAEGNEITEGYTLTLDDMYNSQIMSSFTAAKAGTYVITLTSALSSNVKSTITVTVEDIPDVSKLFGSSYYATLSYTPKGSVTVTFEEYTAGGDGYYLATVKKSDNVLEVLLCYFDGETLSSEHYSGGDDYGFELEFNEAYDIVIRHPTIYYDTDENGNQVVLYESKTLNRS